MARCNFNAVASTQLPMGDFYPNDNALMIHYVQWTDALGITERICKG